MKIRIATIIAALLLPFTIYASDNYDKVNATRDGSMQTARRRLMDSST